MNIRRQTLNFGYHKQNMKSIPSSISYKLFPEFQKPIFILSAPRSGSSYFYEIIRRMEPAWSFDEENDEFWFDFFPYERLPGKYDYISSLECTDKVVANFREELLLSCIRKRRIKSLKILFEKLVLRQPIRYVEKTVANCFHLEAISKIFPDALYIHLIRDGRACISSMVEGWNSGFFWKRPLFNNVSSTVDYWTYPIPPNFETVLDLPLEHICAWSWVQHNQYVLDFFENRKGMCSKIIRIRYEDVLEDPHAVCDLVSSFVGLEISNLCKEYMDSKQISWTTVSPPSAHKWERNIELIEKIIPEIESMMSHLGYSMTSRKKL